MSRPVVLLDVDGVCAQFSPAVVEEINRILGTSHRPEHVRQWDIYTSLDVPPEVTAEVDRHISSPFFCFNLEPYEGAREAVDQIREFADVVAVTTPWDSATWMRERELWLVEKLGFRRQDVVFTHRKWEQYGDVLIDDKVSTIERWVEQWGGEGVIFSQPWNWDDEKRLLDASGYLTTGMWRVNTLRGAVSLLKIILPEQDEERAAT